MPVVSTIPAAVSAFADRLRFPQLFFLTAGLFVFDLLIPDFVPFIDEVLLALLTVLLGMWQQKTTPDEPQAPQIKDVTPRPPETRE